VRHSREYRSSWQPEAFARFFTSPSGRDWTVQLLEVPSDVAVQTIKGPHPGRRVLRFTSHDITLDLADFPANWADRTDEELVALVRVATTPAFTPVVRHRDDDLHA
jgi:hypothetical protein